MAVSFRKDLEIEIINALPSVSVAILAYTSGKSGKDAFGIWLHGYLCGGSMGCALLANWRSGLEPTWSRQRWFCSAFYIASQPLIAEYIIKRTTNNINPTYNVNHKLMQRLLLATGIITIPLKLMFNVFRNFWHEDNHEPEKLIPVTQNLFTTSIVGTFLISGYFIYQAINSDEEEEERRYTRDT